MKTIVIDPVTRIEGHAKITIHLDDDGQVTDTHLPRHPAPRLREIRRGPAVLRNAVDHRAHLRHLSDQPPDHLGQGVRGDHVRPRAADRGEAARDHALRADHPIPRAEFLPSLGARSAARLRLRPGAAKPVRRDRGPPEDRPGRHRAAQIRSAGRSRRWPASASIRPGRCPAASTRRSTRQCATASWPACREAKAMALRTLELFKGIVDQFGEEIAVFGNIPTMYAGLVDDNDNLQLYDGGLRFVDAAGEIVVDRMAAEDYRDVYRRGDGPAIVPEGALLQAARLSRRDLPRRPAGAAQRRRALRHAGGGYGNSRIPPEIRQGGAKFVPFPLRSADRDHLLPGADGGVAERSGHPRPPCPRACRGERAGGCRHGRGAARCSDASLQGQRGWRDRLGQPHHRDRAQQSLASAAASIRSAAILSMARSCAKACSTGYRRCCGRTTRA